MNSDVPHNSDLVSELDRSYLFKFKFCLQFDQTGTWWRRQRITNLFGSASIRFERWLQQSKSNTWYVSEPIIRRCFLQNVCNFVHFGAVYSSIHSLSYGNKRCNTSQCFGAFFVQSFDRFLFPCYLFSLFFLSSNNSGWVFIKINNFTTD